MRPTPWTNGVAGAGAVLAAVGLAFDAPSATAGAAGVAALLATRAALFLVRTARVTDGLEAGRRIERPNVRQGEPVGVVTRVTGPESPGLAVTVRDLPPASAAFDPAELQALDGWCRYYVRMTVPGEVRFRGLEVEARDRFFATSLRLTAPRFVGAGVTVLPSRAGRVPRGAGLATGDIEVERRSVLRGQGVSSFRPFRSGDDPSLVDWKLSAKYGRYFVREPTGQAGGAPLVVVDLPPAGAPGAGPVLSAAADAVEAAVREFGAASLLVVAGGAVVGYRDRVSDTAALVGLLAPGPAEPAAPLFRARDRALLRQRQRTAERSGRAPFPRLAAALRANLARSEPSAFEREVDRALASTGPQDVVLYSAGAGDPSHLALVGAAVRRSGRRLRVLLPRLDPGVAPLLAPYGPVEALA